MGREYEPEEWLAFLVETEDDEGVVYFHDLNFRDQTALESLQDAFEGRVNTLAEQHGYDADWHAAYLAYASVVGHGVGLWEGREPWHKAFEPVVMEDSELSSLRYEIEDTYMTAVDAIGRGD
jgi:hypothetical protein